MEQTKSIQELIKSYLDQFQNLTKEEADYIESIITLPDENKNAFIIAKRIFEDKNV